MAKVTLNPPPQPEPTFTVEMTAAEARLVRRLVGSNVDGYPHNLSLFDAFDAAVESKNFAW